MPRENRCQAQYLVRLECDFLWQAQHFVQFWEIAGRGNVIFFHTECVSKMGRVRSPKRSNRLSFGGSTSGSFRWNLELKDFVAGAVLGEFVRAPRRFICEADQSWDSFCVAGTVFGEVGVWLFVAGAAFRAILGDSRSGKFVFLHTECVSKMGRPEAAGARWRFYRRIMLGLSSDYPRIVYFLAEARQGVSAEILSLKISWQAQYLVSLKGDFTCSAHWKWRFICEADQSWDSFFVPLVKLECDFLWQAQHFV